AIARPIPRLAPATSTRYPAKADGSVIGGSCVPWGVRRLSAQSAARGRFWHHGGRRTRRPSVRPPRRRPAMTAAFPFQDFPQ
ncbi:hypothetical protein, partial [Xanthomonas sacchari]|uniref:hypothetical protein n=1 Tax=Xanthomonas sacchari TaxID=56458 RepID=UPI00225261C5